MANDCYCFKCHAKDDKLIGCQRCWRSYHNRCVNHKQTPFMCDYCQNLRYNITDGVISLKQSLLYLLDSCTKQIVQILDEELSQTFVYNKDINRIENINGTFTESFKEFNCVAFKKFDLKLIKYNVEINAYPNLNAFEGDFNRHFSHNMRVSYSTGDEKFRILSILEKIFVDELNDVKLCAQCYSHKCVDQMDWFCEPCSPPHLLVYARDKPFPLWPAKLIATENETHFHLKWFDPPHYTDGVVSPSQMRPIDHQLRGNYKKYEKQFDSAMKMFEKHRQILKNNGLEPTISINFDVQCELNKADRKRMEKMKIWANNDKQRKLLPIQNVDYIEVGQTKLTAEQRHHLVNNNRVLCIDIEAVDKPSDDSDHCTADKTDSCTDDDSEREMKLLVEVDENESLIDGENDNIANINKDLCKHSDNCLDDDDIDSICDYDIQSITDFDNQIDFEFIENLLNENSDENDSDVDIDVGFSAERDSNETDAINNQIDSNSVKNNENEWCSVKKIHECDISSNESDYSDTCDELPCNESDGPDNQIDLNHSNQRENELRVSKQQLSVVYDISSVESDCFDTSSDDDSVTFMDMVNNNNKIDRPRETENQRKTNTSQTIESEASDEKFAFEKTDDTHCAIGKLETERNEKVKKFLDTCFPFSNHVKKEIKKEIKNETDENECVKKEDNEGIDDNLPKAEILLRELLKDEKLSDAGKAKLQFIQRTICCKK